jgi:hypothetical protein
VKKLPPTDQQPKNHENGQWRFASAFAAYRFVMRRYSSKTPSPQHSSWVAPVKMSD